MNIAFLAHDKKKELMVQFCTAYKSVLLKHNLYAKAVCKNTFILGLGFFVQQNARSLRDNNADFLGRRRRLYRFFHRFYVVRIYNLQILYAARFTKFVQIYCGCRFAFNRFTRRGVLLMPRHTRRGIV